MSIQKEKYLLNFPVNEHFDFFPDSSNVNHAGQQQQDESIWGRCIWNTYFLGFEEWCCFVLKKKKKNGVVLFYFFRIVYWSLVYL